MIKIWEQKGTNKQCHEHDYKGYKMLIASLNILFSYDLGSMQGGS